MSYLVASLFYKIILLVDIFILMIIKTLIILDLVKHFNECK
jgi:hypothetical protein